ncbi:MAG: BACON domain-containing protein [Bacteroidetes bacterium]|uniref:BACON domain-containing protein n=1 Tax=Candidatus Merdivivens pullicola TaxID=2840872 RepID=A0A9D9IGI3_9BACT|nr:BACON domain-containing protein [Candidatus Merdivivens pullicola]
MNVYSVSEWHAQTDADWLLLTKSEDALIVGAERNRSLDARTAVVTVTDGLSSAEFEVSQQAGKVAIYHVEGIIAQGAPARAVSSNGRYVLGFSSAGTWVVDLWSLGDLESGDNIPEENVIASDQMYHSYHFEMYRL